MITKGDLRMLFLGVFITFSFFIFTGQMLVRTDVATNGGIYTVSCDTTTATIIRSANYLRKGILIKNVSSYTVYLSTYANTSSTAGGAYELASGATYSDNLEAWSTAYYGLGTTAACELNVIEKWR